MTHKNQHSVAWCNFQLQQRTRSLLGNNLNLLWPPTWQPTPVPLLSSTICPISSTIINLTIFKKHRSATRESSHGDRKRCRRLLLITLAYEIKVTLFKQLLHLFAFHGAPIKRMLCSFAESLLKKGKPSNYRD